MAIPCKSPYHSQIPSVEHPHSPATGRILGYGVVDFLLTEMRLLLVEAARSLVSPLILILTIMTNFKNKTKKQFTIYWPTREQLKSRLTLMMLTVAVGRILIPGMSS
jgi:hypothetical protein